MKKKKKKKRRTKRGRAHYTCHYRAFAKSSSKSELSFGTFGEIFLIFLLDVITIRLFKIQVPCSRSGHHILSSGQKDT